MEKECIDLQDLQLIAQHMAAFIRWVKPAHTHTHTKNEPLWATLMKDINFLGKPVQFQTTQYFFCALRRALSLQHHQFALMGGSYPVSQAEVYWSILQNSGEPCPFFGSKARQKCSYSQPWLCRLSDTVVSTTSYYSSPGTLLYYHNSFLWLYF